MAHLASTGQNHCAEVLGPSAQVEGADIRVRDVAVSKDALTGVLIDGRTIAMPLAWYPRPTGGLPERQAHWELAGGSYGIHWPGRGHRVDRRFGGRFCSSNPTRSGCQRGELKSKSSRRLCCLSVPLARGNCLIAFLPLSPHSSRCGIIGLQKVNSYQPSYAVTVLVHDVAAMDRMRSGVSASQVQAAQQRSTMVS